MNYQIKSSAVPLFIVFSFLGGCSTAHSNVVAKANGVYSVSISSDSEANAYKSALDQAGDYCKKMGKKLASQGDGPLNGKDRYLAVASYVKDRNPGTTKTSDLAKVTVEFKCI